MFDSKKALYYKNTRNGMYNFDDSTKFSPYLALGCVSARYIYSELKRFEASYGSNESTYWIYFELMWRDYFHFIHMKHGNKLFMVGGIYQKKTNYVSNQAYRDAWCNGLTGFQLVDANMIELNQTGWMSNRGRQNVASFIIKYVNQDWRFGATYFESMLLDYDVSSNYGNWLYNASLGNDPRDNRMFNVNKQGHDYDPSGKYLTKWLPQFKKLPKEFYYKTIELNELQELTFDFKLGKDYPHPIIKPFFKD
jgi:deoxyribodipyrimidine photo-lyase